MLRRSAQLLVCTVFGARFSRNACKPRLGLVVALRDRGDQRLGEIAAGAILLGDPRQDMHHGEIGHRRVAGDALGKLDTLGEPGARRHQIVREAERLAFLGAIGMPGQHHLHHPRHADQPRHPHRAAAADEDPARAFRQRVVGRSLSHSDVARRGEFEPAAHHRAMQHGHHRHLAELNAVESAVPGTRMRDALRDVALGEFAQIKPGGEMLALRRQHHRLDCTGKCVEERLDSENGRIVERIALVRARQRQERNIVAAFGAQRRRQFDVEAVSRLGGAHGSPSCCSAFHGPVR